MTQPHSNSITLLLGAAGRGDAGAADRLWSLVYAELRRLARGQLVDEGRNCSLESAALTHEAYLRLIGGAPIDWANRRHFFGAAARAMRHIRIEDARKRKRIKRGGNLHTQPVDEEPAVFDDDPAELLAVDEALKKLEDAAPRQAEVVMLRYFAGLSVEETAQALGVSPRTVDNEWRLARAWLHRELARDDSRAH